jgi:hypothetical protein
MVEAIKKQLPVNLQESSEAVEPDTNKKLTKPEDLVRLYDIILQVRRNEFSFPTLRATTQARVLGLLAIFLFMWISSSAPQLHTTACFH